jgi:spore maturation protein CgeB
VYHNFDEMRELCKYFLSHEEQRLNILIAGYERIAKEYNYRVAAEKILTAVL